jgi:hypothetical protein
MRGVAGPTSHARVVFFALRDRGAGRITFSRWVFRAADNGRPLVASTRSRTVGPLFAELAMSTS